MRRFYVNNLQTGLALAISGFLLLGLAACSSDDDGGDGEPEEFVAKDSDFANFMDWPLESTNTGPNPQLGDMAHGGQEDFTRNVYFMDGQNPVNGVYPLGTIIVKHAFDGEDTHEYTAMVKRGGDFSPNGGDWEWFMLEADGTIAMRGMFDGMCLNCHALASEKDFVFSK